MKKCKITNDKFSWVLEVDGVVITFDGGSAAEYFEQHYTALGYEVEVDREKWKQDN
jgi:uncharacterized protein YmfQ (DUF2313 family)